MPNLVFYDFETDSSNVSYGQIIQAAAVLDNDNFPKTFYFLKIIKTPMSLLSLYLNKI